VSIIGSFVQSTGGQVTISIMGYKADEYTGACYIDGTLIIE